MKPSTVSNGDNIKSFEFTGRLKYHAGKAYTVVGISYEGVIAYYYKNSYAKCMEIFFQKIKAPSTR